MCGIAGKMDGSGSSVHESLIRAMCEPIVNRGPDAFGCYTAPFIGLGERRLSIIDLSETANPPLCNEGGSIWIVFNGEIYNFERLRSELTADGHVFRTKGDTEVVVHLYEKYGTECLKHLRGMFAFAIWDSTRKVLFAARDRFGKKPFFYSRIRNAFLFGSSINCILADSAVSIEPDFHAIDQYLTHQYVPSPRTAFAGISKLPAAHYLLCDTTGNLTIHRYWSPPHGPVSTIAAAELESELLRRLREAVRIRLIADVPLGVFLSGGIDSAAVTAMVAMETSARVKTFSIGLDDADMSELPYARQVARRYQTDHHEFVVRPSAAEVLPVLVREFAEPFADSSAIPTYYVSKLAREHVTVGLSGDGGDESFLGYDHYATTKSWEKTNFIAYPLRHVLGGALEAACSILPFTDVTSRMSRGSHMLGAQLPERYLTNLAMVKEEEKRAGYTPEFRSLIARNNGASHQLDLEWNGSMPAWDWMSRHDQHYYLPDCLMTKSDVASMANSLELRCPFLDHEFAEFAATIPNHLKRDRRRGKVIMRRALRNLLPSELLEKRKTGFGIPLARWFRNDLKELLRSTLLDDKSAQRGLFRSDFFKKLIDDQITGRRDWSNRLWGFLFLELWFREYVD